jgi:hypothetical protein
LHLLLMLMLLQQPRQLPRAAVRSKVLTHQLVGAPNQRMKLLAAQYARRAQRHCELLTECLHEW